MVIPVLVVPVACGMPGLRRIEVEQVTIDENCIVTLWDPVVIWSDPPAQAARSGVHHRKRSHVPIRKTQEDKPEAQGRQARSHLVLLRNHLGRCQGWRTGWQAEVRHRSGRLYPWRRRRRLRVVRRSALTSQGDELGVLLQRHEVRVLGQHHHRIAALDGQPQVGQRGFPITAGDTGLSEQMGGRVGGRSLRG